MEKLRLIFLLILLTQNLYAQYEPKAKGEYVKHSHYTLDYNEKHEQPNWVYYVLTRKGIEGKADVRTTLRVIQKFLRVQLKLLIIRRVVMIEGICAHLLICVILKLL